MAVVSQKRKYGIGSRCEIRRGSSGSDHQGRIKALVFFIFGIVLFVVVRLYTLQVVAHASYAALAEGQHTFFKELVPTRGEIYLTDKGGLYPVAVNRDTKMAYAVPKEIDNPAQAAQAVADVLQLDKNDLLVKFDRPEDMYEVVKHRLTDDEIKKVNDLGIKGMHLADETYRYYPSDELASNILGFVGWKNNDFGGRYGTEAYFNQELSGTAGQIVQDQDASGRWISVGAKEIVPAKNGDNLVLTIDHTVQYETEKILKSAIEKNEADSGSIIVMDPQTGKILSMANYPTFDPNNYSQVDDIASYRNTALSDAYECGSVFKAVTMAAGLDSNLVNPSTTYTDTGAVKEAGYTIKNSDLKANGVQTMTNVLEKSLNTGAIYVEKMLGNKNFAEYVRRFGFGAPTDIDLPNEAAGNLHNLDNMRRNIQFFTASFGQGITVTPIQLATAYSAMANGGMLMKPQIIDKIIHPDGRQENVRPQGVRRVISEKASALITQMLRSVVTVGHGKQADVPGYLVAGKTGTAQVASTDSRGYAEGTNIGSFAGYAPMNNPRFMILVRINNPRDVTWAESSAAPTFGELMKFLLEYYNIEPTEKYTQNDLNKFDATHNLKDFFLKKTDSSDKSDNPADKAPAVTNENE